ncbi:dihydroxy-acid dehydratase [Telmatospirillum siberiense]|uniref:Dihydroxy-acid dehydratase n=1 Tax=Telmatospirillum siberiense TaxID=382514 RepID=A0A2N3PVC3_9PROT|nr:dihydroxy-acid dehydratase [Telmatospirillum siberiense]PKU24340.1 dihydroxy-acid dehydratase [Telmatospirillum siberiense]
MSWRSRKILEKPDWSFNRSVFKTVGYSDNDLDRPIIGIANAWSDLVPGHENLRKVADFVRKGIYRAGGSVAEFGVIGACDGTAQGHAGMHFILPSRDLIANDVEVMVEAHRLDGIVLLGSCDKIVPGMLMAAARLSVPAIFLPGGPMLGGTEFDGRKSDLTTMSEGLGMLKSKRIDEPTYNRLEETCGPCSGSCAFYGTANTMCCLAEAMGMSLPGAALVPAVYAERFRLAEATGKAIVDLVVQSDFRQIITRQSLENAVRVLMATGGSTNAVLHLSAIAAEIGIDADAMMRIYARFSENTPQIAKVNPASKYDMEDFYLAGGIPRVMNEMRSLLNLDSLTVSGRTVAENLGPELGASPRGTEIISTIEKPFSKLKGLAILRGNLAPDTGVTKPAAIDPAMHVFTGTAKVFNSEEEAEKAILGGLIQEGDVVVIRYEGPKGGPGMREMYKAMKYLYGMGLAKKTALITDGRFSGTNNGCFVGHISPEAAEGGPIAVVEDGDKIVIDIPNNALRLCVDDAVLAERFKSWRKPEPKFTKGYLGLYSRLASSADKGAVMALK